MRAGLTVAVCPLLTAIPAVGHGFSTRRCRSVEAFDLGSATERSAAVDSRRKRLCAAAGLGDGAPVVLRQVHGDRVVEIAARGAQEVAPAEADGLIALAGAPEPPSIAVRSADCVPVLVAERGGAAVAAIHAGWRGTAAAILSRALARLNELGIASRQLVVALGPAIGPCCYAVGPEVVEAIAAGCGVDSASVARRRADGLATTVDLSRALALQAIVAGVPRASISSAPWCTACRPDLFFSYRREAAAAGRQMAVIGWRRREPGLTGAPG